MNDENPRYARHYSLKGFGLEAQQKLGDAKVIVIGAGGLGCPALQYLVAAGVGKVGIVDGDSVALSNLQRQVLFETSDVGQPKASTAAQKLKKINPEILILSHMMKTLPRKTQCICCPITTSCWIAPTILPRVIS